MYPHKFKKYAQKHTTGASETHLRVTLDGQDGAEVLRGVALLGPLGVQVVHADGAGAGLSGLLLLLLSCFDF